jgi:hypothetical protein
MSSSRTPPSGPARSPSPRVGLCDTCVHQQLVHNTRGSTFSLCRRSREEPAYPRYPRIPVLSCPGYEAAAASTHEQV